MSKTLNKTITSKFYATEGGYDEMRRRWSAAVNDKEIRKTLTSSHHALYIILSGKNLGKSFTPITNQVKLDNGAYPYGGATRALNGLWTYDWSKRKNIARSEVWSMFKDLLSENAEELVRALVPTKVSAGDFDYILAAVLFAEVA
jgi:hypothetical protein